jgi:hypothetical protein
MLQMICKAEGDEQDLANYRGISLLSVLLKVYMGVIRRLNDWLEKRVPFRMSDGI